MLCCAVQQAAVLLLRPHQRALPLAPSRSFTSATNVIPLPLPTNVSTTPAAPYVMRHKRGINRRSIHRSVALGRWHGQECTKKHAENASSFDSTTSKRPETDTTNTSRDGIGPLQSCHPNLDSDPRGPLRRPSSGRASVKLRDTSFPLVLSRPIRQHHLQGQHCTSLNLRESPVPFVTRELSCACLSVCPARRGQEGQDRPGQERGSGR
jgi:hypothetical protein